MSHMDFSGIEPGPLVLSGFTWSKSALLYHHQTFAINTQEKEEAYQCISVCVKCCIAGDMLMYQVLLDGVHQFI